MLEVLTEGSAYLIAGEAQGHSNHILVTILLLYHKSRAASDAQVMALLLKVEEAVFTGLPRLR